MVADLDKEMLGDDAGVEPLDKEMAGYNSDAEARLAALDKEEAGADTDADAKQAADADARLAALDKELAGVDTNADAKEASVAAVPIAKPQAPPQVELAPKSKLASVPAVQKPVPNKAPAKMPTPYQDAHVDAVAADLHDYLAEPVNELENRKVHPKKKRLTLSKKSTSAGIAEDGFVLKLKPISMSKMLGEYLTHGAKAAAFEQPA